MRAISIRMPYAWLIVNGHKDIENRDWKTPYRGDILIHVSKTYTRKAHNQHTSDLKSRFNINLPTYETLQPQLGGVIGMATLIDCVKDHPSPWKFPECYGWILSNVQPLPFTPWKGQLGFFNVPVFKLNQKAAMKMFEAAVIGIYPASSDSDKTVIHKKGIE